MTASDKKLFKLVLPACFGPEDNYGEVPAGFSRMDRTIGPVRLFKCPNGHKFVRWGRWWLLSTPAIQPKNPCRGCPLRID